VVGAGSPANSDVAMAGRFAGKPTHFARDFRFKRLINSPRSI
jgi:hypothetical protein